MPPANRTSQRPAEFDLVAQSSAARHLAEGNLRAVTEWLGAHPPRDREQDVEHRLMWARVHARSGNHDASLEMATRALRLTAGRRKRRPYCRAAIADALLRRGELDRAETQIRRGLADARLTRAGRAAEPWLLCSLAELAWRRGMMSFVIRTLERVLEISAREGPGFPVWFTAACELARAYQEHGDLERSREHYREASNSIEAQGPAWLAGRLHARLAEHALISGDLDEAEAQLGLAAPLPGLDPCTRFLADCLEARLLVERGRSTEALDRLDAASRRCPAEAVSTDLAAETAEIQALAMLRLGRAAEALERAGVAVSLARGAHVVLHLRGLRLAAIALARLGRPEQARRTFADCEALVRTTELHRERAVLDAAFRDFAAIRDGQAPRAAAIAPRTSHADDSTRLALADGRNLVTRDTQLVSAIRRAASDELPVLIEGETGTGKELVARLIHQLGARRERPIVVLDCATLPEALIEAELFGVARGAFTGAVSDRSGLVGAADGGSLFLDELAELPVQAQAKLLRLLQEGTYRRLGESRERRVNARFIVSTNRRPEDLVRQGVMKADLFYRLDGHRIRLESLRERRADIAALAEEFARRSGLAGISDAVAASLALNPWPGNIRQLEMVIRVAASRVEPGGILGAIPPELEMRRSASGPAPASNLRRRRVEAERRTLEEALASCGGNLTAAARSLGLSRQAFYKAMERCGLQRTR